MPIKNGNLGSGNQSLDLKSNFIWVLVGNIVFGLSQFLVISLISKFGTIEMVGVYTLALGITAPVFLLLNFNLRSIQATDQKNEYSFLYYFSFRSLTSMITLFIIVIILLLADYSLFTSSIILIVTITKFIESQSDVVFGYFQKIEYMRVISLSRIIRGILTVLVIGLALLTTKSIVFALIGMMAVNLLVFIFFDMKNLYKEAIQKVRFSDLFLVMKDKKMLLLMFAMGLPLGLASALDSLTINSQRYVIEFSLSIEEVGYYASITYLMISGQTIVSALSHAVLPRLTVYFTDNYKKYIRLVYLLVFLGIGMGLILTAITHIWGPVILTILYTEEFMNYSNVLFIVMIIASIWYLTGFLNAALLATRKFTSQLYIYLLSFLVTFIFTIIFTTDFGLMGSAYALLAGMTTRLLAIIIVLVRIITNRNSSDYTHE